MRVAVECDRCHHEWVVWAEHGNDLSRADVVVWHNGSVMGVKDVEWDIDSEEGKVAAGWVLWELFCNIRGDACPNGYSARWTPWVWG